MCRVLLLTLMITMMKSDAASAEVIIISATSGDGIVLPSGQQSRTVENRGEFRWTHLHLLLNKKTTRCHHGRCELQSDGSLRFSQVQVQDSGNYTLQVFDEAGNMKVKKTFLLQVQDTTTTTRGGHVAASPLISCSVLLFLLLVSIIIFILRKRRIRTIITSGQTEDNVYVVMRGHHGNKRKQKKDERKEEEPHYVPCRPAAPKEHEDDVYV